MRARHAIILAAALLAAAAPAARAHLEVPPRPGQLWTSWELEPFVILSLSLTGLLYGRGLRALWQRAGRGAGVKGWEAASFAAGWIILALSLISPLHIWGSALFSAHMTQHELLMLVAAPLVVLGRPAPVLLFGLPPGLAGDVARWTNSPRWRSLRSTASNAFTAWLVHAVVLWGWHIPSLFQAAVRNDFVHALQHASFFFSALLFWWAAMHGGRAVGYGASLLYMFTTAMHSGVLGALITLTRTLWYPVYSATTPSWGLTPLEDQQLGGLIMWIPAGLVYVIASLALLAGWMREAERRAQRWETFSRTNAAYSPQSPFAPVSRPALAPTPRGEPPDPGTSLGARPRP